MPRERGLGYSDPEPQGLVLDLFCFDFLANLMVEMLFSFCASPMLLNCSLDLFQSEKRSSRDCDA